MPIKDALFLFYSLVMKISQLHWLECGLSPPNFMMKHDSTVEVVGEKVAFDS